MIVLGNDILIRYHYQGETRPAFMQLEYMQWLPVCAFLLSISGGIYVLGIKLPFQHMKTAWLGFCSGIIAIGIMLLMGVGHVGAGFPDWYELKNIFSIFTSGFCFAFFSELLD